LSQGLVAVYRDGTAGNEDAANLDQAYDAAEEAARQANLGIWSKPTPVATPAEKVQPLLNRAALAYIFELIVVLTIPITMVSIWRSKSHQDERWRQMRRYTMATGVAAEAEIIRAVAKQLVTQLAELPKDRPAPATIAPLLTLPTASFWSANAERLELLPVEVTVPLLRLYALHEEAARKLALAMVIPTGTLIGALHAVEIAADRAIDMIEGAMGITREKAAEASAPAPAPLPIEPTLTTPPKAAARPATPAAPSASPSPAAAAPKTSEPAKG